jgi:hypothetical protein
VDIRTEAVEAVGVRHAAPPSDAAPTSGCTRTVVRRSTDSSRGQHTRRESEREQEEFPSATRGRHRASPAGQCKRTRATAARRWCCRRWWTQ